MRRARSYSALSEARPRGLAALDSGVAHQGAQMGLGFALYQKYVDSVLPWTTPQDLQRDQEYVQAAQENAKHPPLILAPVAQQIAQSLLKDRYDPLTQFGAGAGRTMVGVAPFLFGQPELGFMASAAEVGGEARQQAAAAGLSPAEQDKAANAAEVKALFLNAAVAGERVHSERARCACRGN